ncbi:hypothetical protein SAMN05216311_10684 [Chitinophaga sp. CF418]|nr:hypothetical protein SAMN05216311_10684 [Chitinophaga sp. CF418]
MKILKIRPHPWDVHGRDQPDGLGQWNLIVSLLTAKEMLKKFSKSYPQQKLSTFL